MPEPAPSRAPVRFSANGVCGIVGLALLAAGSALYSPPLGLIVPGAALFALAVAGAVRASTRGKP